MINTSVLRAPSPCAAAKLRKLRTVVLRLAWRLVLAAAPAGNLNWIVGMPPYKWR